MEKKFNKRVIIYIAAAIIAVIVISVFILMSGGKGETWQEHYDLGQQYLVELSYDKAVLEFTDAIKIDPKNADPYIGLADAYIGLGDTAKAVETLETGLAETGDDRISKRLEELKGDDVPDVSEENNAAEAETETQTESVTETETAVSETEDNRVEVPDLSGMSEEEAAEACIAVGLTSSVSRSNSSDVEKGFVISQTIPAGTKVNAGISVPFTVSEGEKKVENQPKYQVELIEEYTWEWDENGNRQKKYKIKSDYNFKDDYDNVVEYPYICLHGDDGRALFGEPDPTYDPYYDGEKYYSIETATGSVKLSTRYNYVAQFSEKMAYFERDAKNEKGTTTSVRGYMDEKGQELFSYLYTDSRIGGSNGYGLFSGFTDSSSLTEYGYDMHYGLAAYKTDSEGKFGCFDSKGNSVVQPLYDSVDPASSKIIRVGSIIDNGEYEYIDVNGTKTAVISPSSFKEKYGYVDINGNVILKCEYDIAGEFIDGLAVVGYETLENNNISYTKGVINEKGEFVVPCKYNYILLEDNGLIIAFNDLTDEQTYEEDYEFYCYNKNGELLFDNAFLYIATGSNTGCSVTLGNADDRIVAQDKEGNVYLYDLNGKLIKKTEGTIYHSMLHSGRDPFSFLFDSTEIIFIGNWENGEYTGLYMDKQGNIFEEHPYGLTIADYPTYYEKVDGYENIYVCFTPIFDPNVYYYYKITKLTN